MNLSCTFQAIYLSHLGIYLIVHSTFTGLECPLVIVGNPVGH